MRGIFTFLPELNPHKNPGRWCQSHYPREDIDVHPTICGRSDPEAQSSDSKSKVHGSITGAARPDSLMRGGESGSLASFTEHENQLEMD